MIGRVLRRPPTTASERPVGLLRQLGEDVRANRGYPKSQLIVCLFRIAHRARQPADQSARLVALPVGILYKLVVEWVLGVEIPWRTTVGRRLTLFHAYGLVVNDGSVIGDDVRLRHGVTVGNDGKTDDCPMLGDRVDVGAGAVIVGALSIGDDARIGANAVVVSDVPAGATAVGVPAKVVTRGAADLA